MTYDDEAKYKQAMKEAIIAVSYLIGMWVFFTLVAVLLILGIK